MLNWHSLSSEEVLKELDSNKNGLSEKEADKRRQRLGENLLPQEKALSKYKIVLDQFKSPLIYILVLAGIVVLIFKEFTDAIVIFGAVLLNAVVGYVQENKASQALSKLKKMVTIEAEVVRDGNKKIIDSKKLVLGDIIILNPGDKVPADARIIKAENLKVNEMALTGEWLPAEKKAGSLDKTTPLPDRDNMVFMGTVVEDGRGMAVVTSIGVDTEIGKVAIMVKETKEDKTPLQKKLGRFSKIIGAVIVLICVLIFLEGIITGNSFLEMFTIAVAISVAAIPEGLPIALTVILALGMQRILKRKGLVRKLLAAETLGSTSIICTDKTKTLTEGKMRVSEIITSSGLLGGENGDSLLALKTAVLANESFVENPEDTIKEWIVRGRPTDRALLLAGIQAGINKNELEKKFPEVDEIPFNSSNKFIASLRKEDKNNQTIYVCGAPEKLLEISSYLATDSGDIRISSEDSGKIGRTLESLTEKGLRVIAVAYKKINKGDNLKDECKDLVFVGLIALKDPLRKEVKEMIGICRKAGMRTIIVTGDHKLTAKAVAEEIGLKTGLKNIIEGKDLDLMSDKEFLSRVKEIDVYARVEPRHKMRIVDAWQDMGEVVAMTGDGINDAPALKKADIGIALGSGTEVAKEVSDLVLLSDNFNVIVAAVEEGRGIIDNLRKVITYLLSDSFTEMILISVSLLFGFPLPIIAAQILWVNLIEDGLPSIALAFEPKEKDLMQQKPYGHDDPILNKEMKALIFIIGGITDIMLLGLFFWLMKYSHYEMAHIRSIIFAALAIDSLFYVFSCKSLRRNIWHINLLSNKFLVTAWIFGVIALLAALYLAPLQALLKTQALNLLDWELLLALGLVNLILIEFTKKLFIIKSKKKLSIA